MSHSPLRPATASRFGQALRHWRRVRGKSQLALALDADVSPRHISFVETGRSAPSRAMVLTLATALGVPLRERNTLLLAAGYAPAYRESDLDAPELGPARQALELILAHQEPYPAVVMNRHWDLLRVNEAARRLFGRLLDDASPRHADNVLRLMFDPRGLRPRVANWEEVAGALVQRVYREALGGVLDAATSELLTAVLAEPGVPSAWRAPDLSEPLAPFVPVAFELDGHTLAFFSTVTTLGTPQDITLQELRVECFFPADGETASRLASATGAEAPATVDEPG
jgi:transcriptional regulator with XRE-family HTH domain